MTCGADVTVVHTTQSIYMFGIVIGSVIMGGIADRLGRFPVLVLVHALCCITSLASSFANTWTTYAALR